MLSFLEKLAASFWGFLARIAGLVFPFFTRAKDVRGMGGRGVWWALHVLLVATILGLAYWANTFPFVYERLRVPYLFLRSYWLPILLILLYVLGWLGWWLWKLLGPEEDQIDFPDIEQAWEEAAAALNQAGIGLAEAPLFLVLGRPQGGVAALFKAAEIDFTVREVPHSGSAPIHVFANHDAIYVTCEGASLLGRQAELLAEKAEWGPPSAGGDGDGGGEDDSGEGDEFKTVRPGQGRGAAEQREIQAIMRRAIEEDREVTDEERRRMRQLGKLDGGPEAPARRTTVNLLRDSAEKERWTTRLRFLCRLISRDRRPYCPLNGVLMLVPIGASESEEDANQTGAICQLDLTTARDALQIQCPLFAVFCDLETLPGFREFIERFPAAERRRRLGQRFPLQPDLTEGTSVHDVADGSVQWIAQSIVPTWIYKLFQLERNPDEAATVVKSNALLYRLLNIFLERQKRLGRIIARALVSDQSVPWLFGGCYLAATGRDASREQAFIGGVFRRLVEHQSAVSWTPEALAEDADYRRWTAIGYTLMFLIAVAGVAAVVYPWK